MRKIEKTISLQEFRQIHTNNINEQVEKEVQLAFDTIPKHLVERDKRKWMAFLGIGLIIFAAIIAIVLTLSGLLIVSIVSLVFALPGIILFFLGRSTEKEVNSHIQRTVDEHRLYAGVFDHFEDIDFLEYKHEPMIQLDNFKTSFSIPQKAHRKKASAVFSMQYKSKYFVSFQNVMWYWTEKAGKQTQSFNQWMGLLEVRTPDDKLLNNFNFSIEKRHKWLGSNNKKQQLENADFNKAFAMHWNDDVKIRQILTPLAMENILKYAPRLPLKKWFLRKNRNLITIPFTMDYADVMILNFSSKSRDVKTITNYITEDIIKDCYFMYSILGFLKQMPIL